MKYPVYKDSAKRAEKEINVNKSYFSKYDIKVTALKYFFLIGNLST